MTKRLLIFLLIIAPFLGGAQGVSDRINVDRIYSRVGRGVSIYDTLFIKKGLLSSSLDNTLGMLGITTPGGKVVYLPFQQFVDSIGGGYISGDTICVGGDTLIAASYWDKTVNDIQNNNTGKVIFTKDSTYFSGIPDEATKTGRLLHVNQNGKIEFVHFMDLYNDTQDSLAIAPTNRGTWVRDTTNGILSPAATGDKASEAARNMPYQYLKFWQNDLIDAHYEYSQQGNAKMAFLGDSYTTEYAYGVKQLAHAMFGYGGGYETFRQDIYFNQYGTLCLSNWTYGRDATDDYVLHNRILTSTDAGKVTRLSCEKYNKIRIHYKKQSGGGTFTIKKGTAGSTLLTVDTDAAAGDDWAVYDFKSIDLGIYDTIFVTSSDADDITLYGYQFEYNPYAADTYNGENASKRLEVSVIGDPGAPTADFFTSKDTASIRQMLDSLDLSLLCYVNLDPPTTFASDLDSLIGFLQMLRPEMDICLLSSNDEKQGRSDSIVSIYEGVSKSRGVAYIDTYTETGSFQDLVDAGLLNDSIHLSNDYIQMFNIVPKLFPPPNRYGNLAINQLRITDDSFIVKPNGSNFIFTSAIKKSTFTGTFNTMLGFKESLANTSGSFNVSLGSNTLISNTTGANNNAIGHQALRNNTTGSYNIAIGASSGFYNTTGENNIIIGHQAGLGTSGQNYSSCVLIGFNAGYTNRASSNVFIGPYAGYGNNITGSENTAVGSSAMFSNVNGFYNTAIGKSASNQNTSGSYNTSLGHSAGYSCAAGSNNVALGYRAGYSSTGNGNIFIGNQAGENSNTSNVLFIDNSNTATPLIGGDFSANKLTINGAEINPKGTLADNDASPSVAGGNVWQYNGTANSVSIDALDDHVVGAFYTIIGNSDTYTITVIDGTPSGGDSFNLAGGNWVGGSQDVLMLYCIAADAFVEVSRSNN